MRRSLRELTVLGSAWSGLWALALIPASPLWVPAAGAVLCGAAPWLRPSVGRWPWGPLSLGALLAVAAGVIGGAVSASDALVCALVVLLVRRRLGRTGPADDRFALLLATLMLVLGASRTTDPAFVVALVGWLVSAPVALQVAALEHARTRVRRTGAAPLGLWPALAITGLAAAVFLVMPRIGSAPPPPVAGPAVTGFAPEVSLGDMGALLDDPTPVMRVRAPDAVSGVLYLRGTALDRFDGRRWTAGSQRSRFVPTPADSPVRLDIEEASVVENVLFTVGTPVAVRVDAEQVLSDADANLWVVRRGAPLRYTLWSDPDPAPKPLSEADRLRLTDLPEDLDPRFAQLGASIGPSEGGRALAASVRAWLVQELAYTRSPRDVGLEDPLETFLFERRTGHCEYFAAAAVVLLRARGVPARLVNGFATTERNGFAGFWVVRRSHAHSWVEVFDDGRWWTVDPTPGPVPPPPMRTAGTLGDAILDGWERMVIGYDRGMQVGLVFGWGRALQSAVVPGRPGPWPWIGLLLEALAVLALASAATVGARRLFTRLAGEATPRPAGGRVAAAHARAWDLLHRRGWDPPPALPPVAAARWVHDAVGPGGEIVEELAWLHYAVRYGGADDAGLADQARQLADRVADLPAAPR